MDFSLSELQLELQATFRRFFEKECPAERVRQAEPLGFDAELWSQVLELGALTMGMRADHGGGDAGLRDMLVLAEESGRCLAPVPFVEAAVAARVLDAHPEAAGPWLDSVVAGERLVTFGLQPVINGVSRLAPAGAVADGLVVRDGDELLLADIDRIRSSRAPVNLGSAPLGNCVVSGHRRVLASGEDALAAFRRADTEWRILTAGALVGLAEQALHMALEHVKERRAFGVPIGSFQTVAHHLADIVTAIDGARFLAHEAAWSVDVGRAESVKLGAMSFVFAAETAASSAAWSLHFHGGVGYTMDHDIQLYFRRAKAWALVHGDPAQELQAVAAELVPSEEF